MWWKFWMAIPLRAYRLLAILQRSELELTARVNERFAFAYAINFGVRNVYLWENASSSTTPTPLSGRLRFLPRKNPIRSPLKKIESGDGVQRLLRCFFFFFESLYKSQRGPAGVLRLADVCATPRLEFSRGERLVFSSTAVVRKGWGVISSLTRSPRNGLDVARCVISFVSTR